MTTGVVTNMPQLCTAAYGACTAARTAAQSSITYIADSHYLDMISNNAVIVQHGSSMSRTCSKNPVDRSFHSMSNKSRPKTRRERSEERLHDFHSYACCLIWWRRFYSHPVYREGLRSPTR
jgi:hypothetical protein